MCKSIGQSRTGTVAREGLSFSGGEVQKNPRRGQRAKAAQSF
jgi:hypothetical protein